jgi:anti-sigma28 factor (negative regulator of flagellin synthesis)
MRKRTSNRYSADIQSTASRAQTLQLSAGRSRVVVLREQVQSGTYQVDADRLACKLTRLARAMR